MGQNAAEDEQMNEGEESTEDEGKKLTVPIMRQKLIEQEIDIKGLKNKALKDKYNEFFSEQLSP